MKNWSISFKLLCLVLLSILAFVGMGLYGIYNTRATFNGVKEVNATAQEFQRGIIEIRNPIRSVREITLLMVMAPDRALQEKLLAEAEETSRKVDEKLKGWSHQGDNAAVRATFDQMRAAWEEYKKGREFTAERLLKGYREEAFINAIGAGRQQFDAVTSQSLLWQDANIARAETVYRAASGQFDRVFRTSILVIVMTALLVGSLGFFIVRTIAGPIGILTNTASRIADKVDDTQAEQTLAPVLDSGGEVGRLARDFWRMVGTLRTTIQTETLSRARIDEILRSTRAAVSQLGDTSAQLLVSTKEQAAGAEKQADAVTRVVATVEEVTHTARDAAKRAAGVGRTVQHTIEIGNAGRKAVDESVSALNGVKRQVEQTAQDMMALVQQTKAISDIITTVDDIARQSHLLAVNAAIEAANAGEGGKEFTVIAQEIKLMAEQSRSGTAQVRKILGQILKATSAAVESMEGVTTGVSGAMEAGDQSKRTIDQLAAALSDVAQTSAQIVGSAEQEAQGMIQINDAMKNIDHVAREALLAIQGTTKAARQLNDLGNQLTRLSES